ncbi:MULTISPECIES: LysR family transcriptional regulator [unclassified Microbacterium]|uniref:LysR family transcriptional regulator n=1 Tax=unclassified Microbacterium TaxID=2609290 RepID=UPI000EA98AE3|nr:MULTISPECIES: LysR family transcriptional regulator [unclassified Microbacterium]MBT2486179.1 LysR family transcriptional regulator [Microbacterium sp. ISL-108]RKN68904.1 LysR family transcriptional regulator [Microbacterium sp. CGR2]
MDLEAVRTFVAVADAEQFQAAADDLGLTQQAVSKRVAKLERELGVRLFDRTTRRARLSIDGQVFLPHARDLLKAASRAEGSVHKTNRAFRIDVLNTRTAPATELRAFHRLQPEVALDVVTLPDADTAAAIAAVLDGTVDATFRALTDSTVRIPSSIRTERAIDDPHQLLVGPRHPLANHTTLTLGELRTYRIWMPGMRANTEWAGYYADLGDEFGLQIDTMGPIFGVDSLLDELAESDHLSTLVGEGSRYLWPESYDLRRIPIVDPTPVYPHSIIWRADNQHPALVAFLDYMRERHRPLASGSTWAPSGSRRTGST